MPSCFCRWPPATVGQKARARPPPSPHRRDPSPAARLPAALRSRPPPPVDAALLAEGAGRYAIFCAPCHGASGAGDGVVVARGHPPIPPLPADPVLSIAAFSGNLAGAHPVRGRLSPREQWAVARHVAVLRGP